VTSARDGLKFGLKAALATYLPRTCHPTCHALATHLSRTFLVSENNTNIKEMPLATYLPRTCHPTCHLLATYLPPYLPRTCHTSVRDTCHTSLRGTCHAALSRDTSRGTPIQLQCEFQISPRVRFCPFRASAANPKRQRHDNMHIRMVVLRLAAAGTKVKKNRTPPMICRFFGHIFVFLEL
jgi:hypothetical protein